MMPRISRRAFATMIAGSMLMPGAAFAADALKEIHIDWATYNPVSMILKQKGLLEKEFAKDGINIVWVQSAGSNKALEFLNAGSIDFGSTAGSAALVAKINGNPIKSIYVYSRPEWTALVTTKDSQIAKIEDLKGKRVAVTRGTDPHIFLVRALLGVKLTEKDITPVLLQHPDGKTALIRGDVQAWAGLDPMMADRKSTRLNSSHSSISYAVFCLKKKKIDAHLDGAVPGAAHARIQVQHHRPDGRWCRDVVGRGARVARTVGAHSGITGVGGTGAG